MVANGQGYLCFLLDLEVDSSGTPFNGDCGVDGSLDNAASLDEMES